MQEKVGRLWWGTSFCAHSILTCKIWKILSRIPRMCSVTNNYMDSDWLPDLFTTMIITTQITITSY
jgi:hypothetical protein